MNKHVSFEDISNGEIRWPRQGEDPFVPSWGYSSVTIPENELPRAWMMVRGYLESADHLVDIALNARHERESLIFPILFLYRHYIEIHLKYFISTYGHHAGVEPDWRTHDLPCLWSKFQKILDEFGADDGADSSVKYVVTQFSKVDPKSFSYRYPCDKQGRTIPVARNNLDLETIRDVMTAISGYFDACDSHFDNLDSAADSYC